MAPFQFKMTTKEQNEKLWRAIDFYMGWLQEIEEFEHDANNVQARTAYSNASMQLFDLMREEGLYEMIKERE